MSDAEKDVTRWLAVQEQASEFQRLYADWRRGQALFNALHYMDPVLADLIRGTSADPFNSDGRTQAFAEAVMRGRVTPSGGPGA